MNQDVRIINSSNSFGDAINTLIKQLRIPESFTKEDFLKDYRNDFLRLILYLAIFKNEAKDWINQDIRIGYDRSDNQLNEGFKPEWHHFFPKKVLKDFNVEEPKVNMLANIVVLNEKANRIFKASPPERYIEDSNVVTIV